MRYTIKYKVDGWLFDTNFQYETLLEALIDLKQCSETSENKFYVIDNVKDVQITPTLFDNIVVEIKMFINKLVK
jgi:hypothetical protein